MALSLRAADPAHLPCYNQKPANKSAVPVKIIPMPPSGCRLAEAVLVPLYPTMSNGLPPPLFSIAWSCCCCTGVNPSLTPAAGVAEVWEDVELVL